MQYCTRHFHRNLRILIQKLPLRILLQYNSHHDCLVLPPQPETNHGIPFFKLITLNLTQTGLQRIRHFTNLSFFILYHIGKSDDVILTGYFCQKIRTFLHHGKDSKTAVGHKSGHRWNLFKSLKELLCPLAGEKHTPGKQRFHMDNTSLLLSPYPFLPDHKTFTIHIRWDSSADFFYQLRFPSHPCLQQIPLHRPISLLRKYIDHAKYIF